MVFLKEDGSLDIERIDQLPVEEHMEMLGELNSKQWDYYISTWPINESNDCPRNINVDYGIEDERSGIDIDDYLRKWKTELDNR